MLPHQFTKEKIKSRVHLDGECWIWSGTTNQRYGIIGTNKDGNFYAHRVAFELWHGPIPDRYYVCHRCDNPLCVNPGHLFVGAPADNTADMKSKGRHVFGSKQPTAKLTDVDVIQILDSDASSASLARHYGVSQSTISMIRSGRIWAHIKSNRRNTRWSQKHIPERKPPQKPWQHGTVSGYSYRGCRCDECKAANRIKGMKARAARKFKAEAA